MMQLENIRWNVEDGVAVATIDRPKALNALDTRTLKELDEVVTTVFKDTSIRALILTGGGEKAFVAGADVSEMVGLQPIEARCFAEIGQRTIGKLEALPVPTIAAVNGFALGGGCELAMACDLIYASEKAKFGQPEVNLGIIPGFGGTQRLARRVGLMRAKEMILTGEAIDAAKAKEIGLALEVVPGAELMPLALARAKKIASRPRVAVDHAKRATETGAGLDLATACGIELDAFALTFATEDAHEGMRAFLEKRPPKFKHG
jgi:enoyl-CoA hydratase